MRQFVTILMMFVSLAVFAQERVHVGDIYCTDNTTVSPENFATSGKTALGVVFFVDNSQQHGWALALNDAGSGGRSISHICVMESAAAVHGRNSIKAVFV